MKATNIKHNNQIIHFNSLKAIVSTKIDLILQTGSALFSVLFCWAFFFLLSQTYCHPIISNLMWSMLIQKWHNQDLTAGFLLESYIFAFFSFSIIISVSIFHWVNLLQSLVTLEKMTKRPAASETAACFPALSPGCHWHGRPLGFPSTGHLALLTGPFFLSAWRCGVCGWACVLCRVIQTIYKRR